MRTVITASVSCASLSGEESVTIALDDSDLCRFVSAMALLTTRQIAEVTIAQSGGTSVVIRNAGFTAHSRATVRWDGQHLQFAAQEPQLFNAMVLAARCCHLGQGPADHVDLEGEEAGPPLRYWNLCITVPRVVQPRPGEEARRLLLKKRRHGS